MKKVVFLGVLMGLLSLATAGYSKEKAAKLKCKDCKNYCDKQASGGTTTGAESSGALWFRVGKQCQCVSGFSGNIIAQTACE